MNNLKTHFFDCECMSPEHVIRFMIDSDDSSKYCPDLYLEVQLNKLSFFKRLTIGIKYILGINVSDYWECTIIKKEDVFEIKQLLTKYEEILKIYNHE